MGIQARSVQPSPLKSAATSARVPAAAPGTVTHCVPGPGPAATDAQSTARKPPAQLAVVNTDGTQLVPLVAREEDEREYTCPETGTVGVTRCSVPVRSGAR